MQTAADMGELAMEKAGAFGEYTDEQLAELAKTDTAAASELTARLFTSIRAMAMSVEPRIWDDLLQEGLLGMISAIGSYDPKRGSVRTYALACARNRMLSTVKQNSLQGGGVDPTEQLEDREESENDFGGRLDELYEAMERVLTETERGVLACYMMGCGYGETSRRLGISVKSVDNALQRARRKLRKEFGLQ